MECTASAQLSLATTNCNHILTIRFPHTTVVGLIRIPAEKMIAKLAIAKTERFFFSKFENKRVMGLPRR